jgi:uncharacterized damage-inducible protein DinB
MKLTELFLAEIEREAPGTRRALERVPEGRDDWKPHQKSMELGRLSQMVAGMFGWVDLTVNRDYLDFNPPAGEQRYQSPPIHNRAELLAAFDQSVALARKALENTTDEHLMLPWQYRNAGQVINEQPRYIVIRDGVLNHLAHHRGQLTVYLRLLETPVPAIYGPSADEQILVGEKPGAAEKASAAGA